MWFCLEGAYILFFWDTLIDVRYFFDSSNVVIAFD